MNEDRLVDGIFILCICVIIYLKIIGVITVSWLWLLSPIWILFSLGLLLALCLVLIFILEGVFNKHER